MTDLIAALPMYDWPELRADVDAQWAALRDRLRAQGLAAPERLARRNGDLPAVPGGIRDGAGQVIAADPATLPPEEFDLFVLWRHPALLVGQTCWGPMETTGLDSHVSVVGQPDYSDVTGGQGGDYRSALVMRRSEDGDVAPPDDGRPVLPLTRLAGARFAYNSTDSMSGFVGLARDLAAAGHGLEMFAAMVETGGHRYSVRALAENRADVAAIDCRSWALAKRFEPQAAALRVVGWTGARRGLPFIAANALAAVHGAALRAALAAG